MSAAMETKQCSGCKREREVYRNGWCRSCSSSSARRYYWRNREKVLAAQSAQRKAVFADPVRGALANKKAAASRRGLTLAEYDAMLARVAVHGCDICGGDVNDGKRNGRGMIDHDHRTGKVRGVLCRGCNSGIGLLGDDPDRLEAAAAYIRRHTKASL